MSAEAPIAGMRATGLEGQTDAGTTGAEPSLSSSSPTSAESENDSAATGGTVWDTDPARGSRSEGGQGGFNGGPSTAARAKSEASGVVQEGVDGGKQVASVATDQAKEVASEAGRQAKLLMDQARSELRDHAASQQDRVAGQLHSLSQELGAMASKSEQDGLATDLARQASRQMGDVAHWLSEREPGSLVTELRGFARNKPGTFLALAAGIGLVAGRVTRGIQAGAPESDVRSGTPLSDLGTSGYPARQTPFAASEPSGSTATTISPGYKSDDDWQAGQVTSTPAGNQGLHTEESDIGRPVREGSEFEDSGTPRTSGMAP